MLDSLKKGLPVLRGVAKVDRLLHLSYFSFEYDISQAFKYASDALAEAQKIGYRPGEKHALSLQGEYFYNINEFEEARSYLKRSQSIKTPDSDGFAGYNYLIWANTYRLESKVDSAWHYYNLALPRMEMAGNPYHLHYAYIQHSNMLLNEYR
ncbi:MAG: hypothetical protein JNJ57_09165, partial [Saprospiraceae bacterium]|nr:hypothetical protein [Saprospiraceae bacterium]